jgi:cysteine-rich repeat protein
MREPGCRRNGTAKLFKRTIRPLAGLLVGLVALVGGQMAWAHESPEGCTGNQADVDVLKDKTSIQNGETVTYTVTISNNDIPTACDITATLTFHCPAADGTPTGIATACATNADIPAPSGPFTLCVVVCTVNVNPGVTTAQAQLEGSGTLHDNPYNDLDRVKVLINLYVISRFCGDGIINDSGCGETCDTNAFPANAPASHGACRPGPCGNPGACTFCGDGIINDGELCDDGNGVDTDACRNNCLPPECGDGIVGNAPGETCDPPGSSAGQPNVCRADCTFCGDGHLDAGEVCDDHNNTAGDDCSPTCQVEWQCVLAVEKTCAVPRPLAPFVCSDAKPIHSLTLKWEPGSNTDPTRWVLTNPGQVIDIKAWNGSPGGTLVATRTNIQPGDVVTVTGFSGPVLYWEIFGSGTGFGTKLGNSAFHLSCSDVDMNTSDDCGKLEGDLKVTSGFTGLINDWRFEGMGGDTGALVCTPAEPIATSECAVENTPVDCTTQGKPTSLTFLYNGNNCANPDNNNPQSGKFLCTGSIDPSLPITVSNAQGYLISPATVNPGETFTVSSGFHAHSLFTLTNAGGTETESIHTSCAQVLAVGNVFGSLTLVAFNGNEGGNEVTYTYKVTNTCATDLTDVTLVDDRLGNVTCFNGELAAGASKTCTATASISQTTTNIVTASATGAQSAEASATVTVPPLSTACATGAIALVVKDKEAQWKLTNGTSNKLQIAEITITWPAANGFLDEVKLDGRKINSGNLNPPSADLTSFEGSIGARSIDHNKSSTLHFKFQNNASLGAYTIEVRFTNNCSVTFP